MDSGFAASRRPGMTPTSSANRGWRGDPFVQTLAHGSVGHV